jgi:acetylornithine deacetylase/succinyl-diaminopimelate desuccinylase-like protein
MTLVANPADAPERRHADDCGAGPVGGNAHSEQEYPELDSIVPRTQTLALAILRTGVD